MVTSLIRGRTQTEKDKNVFKSAKGTIFVFPGVFSALENHNNASTPD